MVELLYDNHVVECIQLMNKSVQDNNYEPYGRNERIWIENLCKHIDEQLKNNPMYLALGVWDDKTGELRGFMLASAFQNYYTQEWVMDVKDCIVNHDRRNGFIVKQLFDAMIEHVKNHGGSYWRADSIRAADKAEEYTKFLQKNYDAIPFSGVHGKIK